MLIFPHTRLGVLITALLLCCSASQTAQGKGSPPWTASVDRVLSGDTLVVARGDELVTVALHDVDCPELGQPFGAKAKAFVSKDVSGQAKMVEVRVVKKGRSGRLLARVYPMRLTYRVIKTKGGPLQRTAWRRDKVSLGEQLLTVGLAWWRKDRAPKAKKLAKKLAKLQTEARRGKRGLWAQKRPISPWTFRQRAKKKR